MIDETTKALIRQAKRGPRYEGKALQSAWAAGGKPFEEQSKERLGGVEMNVQEWQQFLQRWSDDWLARDETFPSKVRKSCWLGSRPATEKQVAQLEKRIGYELPPSYRNFLHTTNGWSRTSEVIKQVRPANQVKWLQEDDPQLFDTWVNEDEEDSVSPNEYFSYDGRPIFKANHLRESLIIADPIDGDSMIYVLNPKVVAENGEWEAWRFAHWIPGAERFPSFELLMRAEYESFLAVQGKQSESVSGPFDGPYAPERSRKEAIAIGGRKPKPPRLTVPQLIAQLESSAKKSRLAAAKQLFREFRTHDLNDVHPELNVPIARILRSKLETDVRAAAAYMLGSYGNVDSVPILIDALADHALTSSVVMALWYLAISIHDSRIGDAMVNLMETSKDYHVLDNAMNILEELRDSRIASIGLRLLDHADDIAFEIPAIADKSFALAYQRSSLRYKGAFAFAEYAESATEELSKRLFHSNGQVRAAAVAALRKEPNRGPSLAEQVGKLLNDPDSTVRQQAETTLRFLGPSPEPEIS